MDDLNDLLDPDYVPTKTYSQLLEEGVQHQGGLAQLAQAETGGPSSSTEAQPSLSQPTTSI